MCTSLDLFNGEKMLKRAVLKGQRFLFVTLTT